MIWLALQERVDSDGVSSDVPFEEVIETPSSPSKPVSEPILPSEPPLPAERQADIVPELPKPSSSLSLPEHYRPIPVPDPPAIPDTLQQARALRLLARSVPVGVAQILDEAATVDRIADTGVWQLVLKLKMELWLDVALVYDLSPSMSLWGRFGKDLRQLLSRYGEFRDLREWRLEYDSSGKVSLRSRNGTRHNPRELLTGDRRRLVVIVSDCVAPAWHDGKIHDFIKVWTEELPTVVLQVFPERLWHRTALARAIAVEFRGRRAGLPSNQLIPTARSYWDRRRISSKNRPESQIYLPIVTIEPEFLLDLAQVLVGDRRASVAGIVWDKSHCSLPANRKQLPSNTSRSKPRDRVDTFFLTASPTARELGGLLATAPVITLPIIRLIQRAILPESSSVHVAEVLMSGLFKLSSDEKPTIQNAERLLYQPIDDGVRDRLLQTVPSLDGVIIIERVSRYIAKGLGKSMADFKALLRAPNQDSNTPGETAFITAFATVTAKVLRGLGDEFAAIADSLAPPLPSPDTKTQPLNFTLEDREYEVAKIVEFLPLHPFDYEPAIITDILKFLDFETADPEEFSVNPKVFNRDVYILIEQSVSMIRKDQGKDKTRWQLIAEYVSGDLQDLMRGRNGRKVCDKVTVYFFGSPTQIGNCYEIDQSSNILRSIFYENRPRHKTYIAKTFEACLAELRLTPKTESNKNGAFIIIYTDGMLDDHSTFAEQIHQIAEELPNADVLKVIIIGVGDDIKSNPEPFLDLDFNLTNNKHNIVIFDMADEMEDIIETLERQLRDDNIQHIIPEWVKQNYPEWFAEYSKSVRSKQSLENQIFIRRYTRNGQYFCQPLGNSIGLEMVLIPGGTFLMGSPDNELDNYGSEKPQHPVTVGQFFIGRYLITQEQWRVVASYESVERRLEPEPSYFKGNHRPVERVNWDDAIEFCKRLSVKTGRTYRLPTEAEWEYACRAETQTPFHFGETITDELANYNGIAIYGRGKIGKESKETTDVGSFPPNNFGLHDMHGNVWEWCKDDWHDNYAGAPNDGSAWIGKNSTTTGQVVRGGSWNFLPRLCRSACRDDILRGYLDNYIGFRVVCEP
ncbi:SUMF1/EgtB/PvdO family nonheme iron enzyme [Laspinema sp. D1]|uniref:SUMF1/EgtB/PvdO family nonheme iron enzyme n=1 Tax=Laspinema palackyanum D2a TaxID=2953684 RepID=A0ABT2MKW9_9CYAN|nr:SUMF1/EgtB/PvdO family nonheme iron enzyme [Laspinema sp. D2a]